MLSNPQKHQWAGANQPLHYPRLLCARDLDLGNACADYGQTGACHFLAEGLSFARLQLTSQVLQPGDCRLPHRPEAAVAEVTSAGQDGQPLGASLCCVSG